MSSQTNKTKKNNNRNHSSKGTRDTANQALEIAPKAPVKKKRWKRWKIVLSIVLLIVLLIVSVFAMNILTSYQGIKNAFGSSENIDAVDNLEKDPFAVMLLGKGSTGDDGEEAADSIMLLVINPAAKVARIVSVPRDSYLPRGASCDMQGYYDKIANSGEYISCLQDTLEEIFDLKINYHVSLNFRSFISIVDTLGGVEMDVPDFSEEFNAWTGDGDYVPRSLKTGDQWCDHDSARNPYAVCFTEFGPQNVDGEHALALARSRHYDSDFGRGRRQTALIKAIANKVVQNFSISLVNDLLHAIQGNVETNIPEHQFLDFAKLGQKLMSRDVFSLQSLQLDGASSKFQGDLYYASFNQVSLFSLEDIRYKIAQTFSPDQFPPLHIDSFYYDPAATTTNDFDSKYQFYDDLGFLTDRMDVQDVDDVQKYNINPKHQPDIAKNNARNTAY